MTPPSEDSHEGQPRVRYVFVGGPPRSGTTLVQNILDSHPRVCGGPEFLHLPDILELRAKMHRSIQRGFISDYATFGTADARLREFIESFLEPMRHENDAWVLSEKTPSNVLVFSELAELFPDARFVFVVRDPRAIVASLLRVGERGREEGWDTGRFTRNTSDAIRHVAKHLDAGFSAARGTPDRVLPVVYERLVTDPESETRRLAGFLGVEWSPRMLHPGRFEHPGEDAIVNEVWYDEEDFRRDPDPAPVDKWKGQLSRKQKLAVTTAFVGRSDLRDLGYELARDGLSELDRRVLWPAYRIAARLLSPARSALGIVARGARGARRRLVRAS